MLEVIDDKPPAAKNRDVPAEFILQVVVQVEFIGGAQQIAELPVYFLGEPLLFRFVTWLVHGTVPADHTLLMGPLGLAAWFGLLVTALNLMPIGQLDGGHVSYALFGPRHRAAAWPLLGVLAAVGLLWPGWWVWALVFALLGPRHPPVFDEDTPLDRPRRWVGWCALLILALSFSPRPIWIGTD